MEFLKTIFPYLIVAGLAATTFILFTGVIGFARGKRSGKTSNAFMRARVIAQLITVILFMIFISFLVG